MAYRSAEQNGRRLILCRGLTASQSRPQSYRLMSSFGAWQTNLSSRGDRGAARVQMGIDNESAWSHRATRGDHPPVCCPRDGHEIPYQGRSRLDLRRASYR